jgi:creatinine amidohydrolase
MKISEMNWMQVEAYLKNDDRAIVPLGSTEQHAYLSLSVDSILAEKMALDSAEPLAVPVFPVVAYGVTPYFMAYPGTITMRIETYLRVIRDILDSLKQTGFRRILFVNGHGGNSPANSFATEWMAENLGVQVKFHDWWRAPQTWARVKAIDSEASHASWMENFPWTRLAGVVMPDSHKVLAAQTGKATQVGEALRAYLGDGNFGGWYQRSDAEMLEIWQIAVGETRALIENNWE